MFLDLLQHPPLSPIPSFYHTDLLMQDFSPFFRFSLSIFDLFPPHLSVFICTDHHSSVNWTGCWQHARWLTFTLIYCSLLLWCVCVCDVLSASGTTASLHLKHFRETHICCFRAQRDMPWQRLFEVASQGEPKPERGIWETIKKR